MTSDLISPYNYTHETAHENIYGLSHGSWAGRNNTPALTSSSTYSYRFYIKDAAENIGYSDEYIHTTLGNSIPVITLTGNDIYLQVGDSYVEQGAVWLDAEDGTGVATIGVDTVNTAIARMCVITYDYTDTNGNVAVQKIRNVVVNLPLAIVIEPTRFYTGSNSSSTFILVELKKSMKKLLILLLTFATTVSFGQRSHNRLVREFDVFFNNKVIQNSNLDYQKGFHGGDIYWMILGTEGEIRAFQGTKNYKYLDRALGHVYGWVNNAMPAKNYPSSKLPKYTNKKPQKQPRYKDNYLTWDQHGNPQNSSWGTNGGNPPLNEMHGIQVVPHILAIMYFNPEIRKKSNSGCDGCHGKTYQDDFNFLLNFIEKNVWDKWDPKRKNARAYGGSGIGTNEALMRNQTHISSHASTIALYLWKITGKRKYKDFLDDWNYNIRGHGYNSTKAGGFNAAIRNHTYTEKGKKYYGYIWENDWGFLNQAPKNVTDTNHWQAEFRHLAYQLMFDDNWWDAKGPKDFRKRMLATAKWGLQNSQYGKGNYFPNGKPGTKPGKTDGHRGVRSAAVYYGVALWGRFDESFQRSLENCPLNQLSVKSIDRNRVKILKGNLVYNRAHLDGRPMFYAFPAKKR